MFAASVLVNALFGFGAMLPYNVVVVLALAAGLVVQGNFSNLTSDLLVVAEPSQLERSWQCTSASASPAGLLARYCSA